MVSGTKHANRLDRLFEIWASFIFRGAWLIAGTALLLAAAAFCYAKNHLGINTDLTDMISPELPFRKTYAKYQQAFPQYSHTLAVVVDADTPEFADHVAHEVVDRINHATDTFEHGYLPAGGQFLEENGFLFLDLADMQDLTDDLAKAQPFLVSLFQDQSLRGLLDMLDIAIEQSEDDDDLDLDPFFARLNLGFRKHLDQEPYNLSWQDVMANEDSEIKDRRRFITARLHVDYSQLLPAKAALERIHAWADEFEGDGSRGIRIRATGGPVLGHEEMVSLMRGSTVAGAASFVLVCISLLIGLRSVAMATATIVSLVIGILYTGAFATWAIGHLNLISIAFAVLYIGLGVDYGIHLCLRYREVSNRTDSKREIISGTLRHMAPSLGLCTVSTAIGFYAFVPTAYAGVSELGLISGTGMFISLFISLTILPALVHVLSPSEVRVSEENSTHRLSFLKELPFSHHRKVCTATTILIVLAIYALFHARFDYDPVKLRDPGTESVQTIRDIIADSGKHPSTILVLAADGAAARELSDRLEDLPTVDKAVSVFTYVPEKQEEKLFLVEEIDLILGSQLFDASIVPAPTFMEQQESIQQFLATIGTSPMRERSKELVTMEGLLRRIQDHLRAREQAEAERDIAHLEDTLLATVPIAVNRLRTALSPTDPFSVDDLPKDLFERWVSRDGQHLVQVFPAMDITDNRDLKRFVEEVRTVAPDATAGPASTYESGKAVVLSFQQALLSAIVLIALLLILVFRNLVDPLLVLMPLIVAGAFTGATAVLSGIQFNFANIIALPLLLGLGVDNGVHMVHRIRDMKIRKNRLLHTSTARGIFFSALTTIFSFGTLGFLSHPGTASMGQLLTLGVFFTMVITLFVLPAFLFLRQR